MPAVARLATGARTPARCIVPRRDCSVAPSSSAFCSRARSAGDGIRPSLDGYRDARTRRRHLGIPAFAHRSAERAALQHLGSDDARNGGVDATGDSERHRAAVGRRRNRLRLHRGAWQEEESKEEARRTASAAAATAAAARRTAGRRGPHQRAAAQGAGTLCRRLQAAGCAATAAGAATPGCL